MKKSIVACLSLGLAFFTSGCGAEPARPLVTHEYEVASFSKIKMDLFTSDLEFKVGENDQTKVVCREEEKQYHTVEVKDDTLTIQAVDERTWQEKGFDWRMETLKVTVFVPAKEFAEANIGSHTGDIAIPSDYSFGELFVNFGTGNVSVLSDVTGTSHIEGTTGNLHVEGEAGIYDVSTSTGNITLKEATAKTIKAKASTGNITFEDADASEAIDATASTGNIRGSLLSGKTFEATSKTGKVEVPASTPGAAPCHLKTSTGDIKITVKA